MPDRDRDHTPEPYQIPFAYELPPVYHSQVDGWRTTMSSASVTTALLAVLAGYFLHLVKSPNQPQDRSPNSSIQTCLLWASYCAVIFNANASLVSLLVMHRLGQLPIRSARTETLREDFRRRRDPSQWIGDDITWSILDQYQFGSKGKKRWEGVLRYWVLNIILGCCSVVGQILLYIWLQESPAITITMTCVYGLTCTSTIVLMLYIWV